MAHEDYILIYQTALGLGIFSLVITIILFVWLQIPKVFGELSGFSAKKSIKIIQLTQIQRKNAKTTARTHYKRGFLQRSMGQSETVREANSSTGPVQPTENLALQTIPLDQETALLSADILQKEEAFEIEQDLTFYESETIII